MDTRVEQALKLFNSLSVDAKRIFSKLERRRQKIISFEKKKAIVKRMNIPPLECWNRSGGSGYTYLADHLKLKHKLKPAV